MKCPYCRKVELVPAKKLGYYSCSHCGFLYKDKVLDDPNLDKYSYEVESFRCKDGEPSLVFRKAAEKFNNGAFEVVALNLVRGDYSLFGGQRYTVLTRRLK